MRAKFIYLGIITIFLFSGCVPVLIGAGAATGYALSNDAALGKISLEYRPLWDLCIDVLEEKDVEFLAMNQARGYIKAIVSEYAVTIRINSIGRNTQRLKVAARRYYMPKPQFAQKIFLEISGQLK
ncbi:MAG: hypothetical protein K9L95_03365 [Candidatus Omnitrophica bacterium]|nr:hypothetical protein [Candidatus Omnitrophota bacterium]MCF7877660.1 hypothetical protein [Candidatus Omnitrophota bacterium]MCF7878488.1 hypothetical protein [Candidatus Omnitrophota bacterium]